MVTYNKVIWYLEEKLKLKSVRTMVGVQSSMWAIKHYRGLEYSNEFEKDLETAQKRRVKFHIDPALPVDLVMVAKKRESLEVVKKAKKVTVNYYWVFWVVLSNDPGLKKRLLFYQFYLSRVSEPYRVKMIIVTASDASQDLRNKLQKIAQENKFGLWIVNITKNEPTQTLPPKTFRDRMEEEFKEPQDNEVKKKFPEGIRNRAKDLAMFFDTYVRDAVEAIVGITPEEAGKRYIDRKVLDLAFDLVKVSYRQKVQDLVTEHLSKKTNDYDFVTHAFTSLWRESKFPIVYSDFLKTFEPALFHLSAGGGKTYRDHYLHQFQVFLLGLHIIDKFYEKLKFDRVKEMQWLVASSSHDVAYPVQLYDGWSKRFFKKVFGISDVGSADLKSQFIDKTLLSCMGYLVDSLCKTHMGRSLAGNWLGDEKDLVKFFYKKITMVKHHCVLSAISLLKKALADQNVSDSVKGVFVPAALAIALHDEEVWNELNSKLGLSYAECGKDPIAFLLLFCDCVQEWGRPKGPERDDRSKQIFLLKEKPQSSSKTYSLTIWTPFLRFTNSKFRAKKKEGDKLKSFLCAPKGVTFKMSLADSSGNVKETCTIRSKP